MFSLSKFQKRDSGQHQGDSSCPESLVYLNIHFLIRIFSENGIQNYRQENKCKYRSDSECAVYKKHSELVHNQCYNIRKNILEQNCKPEPLAAVEFAFHCCDCGKTRTVQKIEEQKAECCDCCREPFRNCKSNRISVFYKLF